MSDSDQSNPSTPFEDEYYKLVDIYGDVPYEPTDYEIQSQQAYTTAINILLERGLVDAEFVLQFREEDDLIAYHNTANDGDDEAAQKRKAILYISSGIDDRTYLAGLNINNKSGIANYFEEQFQEDIERAIAAALHLENRDDWIAAIEEFFGDVGIPDDPLEREDYLDMIDTAETMRISVVVDDNDRRQKLQAKAFELLSRNIEMHDDTETVARNIARIAWLEPELFNGFWEGATGATFAAKVDHEMVSRFCESTSTTHEYIFNVAATLHNELVKEGFFL